MSYSPAFTGSTKEVVTQIASGPVPRLLDVSPHIDSRLDDVVSRAMALDPADRYDDLEELRAVLAEVRAGIDPALDEPQSTSVLGVAAAGSPRATGTSKSRRSTRRRSAWRSPAVVAGTAATAAVMITIAAFIWSGTRNAPERAATVAPVAAVAVPSPIDRTPAVEPPPPSRDRKEPITAREQARRPATTADVTTPAIGAAEPAPPPVETPQLVAPTSEPVSPPAPVPQSTPERAPVAAATAAAPPVEVPSDSDTIAETLRRYDAAYRSLDVGALLKVFPSLGNAQVEQLRRTFAGMITYEMDTQVLDTKVGGDGATVLARVARRMAPRVGGAVVNEVQTEFRLQRSGRNWVIVGVTTR